MPPPPAVFVRASPYGLAAYPGFCRGFFSSRCAEKMAASAAPIVCRHRPSAAESLQELAAVLSAGELQLASPWDRRAPARALRVIAIVIVAFVQLGFSGPSWSSAVPGGSELELADNRQHLSERNGPVGEGRQARRAQPSKTWNDTAAEGRWRHTIGVADAAIFSAPCDEKKPRQKPGLAEGVRAKP